jgi:hypothetical protein
METQLPTPPIELLILTLYLSSINLLLGLAVIAWVIKRHGRFNWIRFIIISLLTIILSCIAGFARLSVQ